MSQLNVCMVQDDKYHCFTTNPNEQRMCKYYSAYADGKCSYEKEGICHHAVARSLAKEAVQASPRNEKQFE